MRVFADYHTHTIYSHGTGTVEDNVRAALARGLAAVAITDHGPASFLAGVRRPATFLKIKADVEACNRKYRGFRALAGVEANVVGPDGELDVPGDILRQLDMTLVGLHPFILPARLREGALLLAGNAAARVSRRYASRARVMNTKALVEAVWRHRVDAVAHPGLRLSIDTVELARACAKRGTALEINASHGFRTESFARAAFREGVSFMINSDAHRPADVGRVEPGVHVAEAVGIPAEQVINARAGGGDWGDRHE